RTTAPATRRDPAGGVSRGQRSRDLPTKGRTVPPKEPVGNDSMGAERQDAIDGSRAGQRTDDRGLRCGADGRGPDPTRTGSRRGRGSKPGVDGADGPLQFGREAMGDTVAGPRPVVEAVWAGLPIAEPPLCPERAPQENGTSCSSNLF